MITTPYYSYSEELFKAPILVDYKKFSYTIRKYNRAKKNYLVDCWLNTFIYNFKRFGINFIVNLVFRFDFEYEGYDREYVTNRVRNYNANDPHYYTRSHFEWNYEKLYEDFGDKKYVDQYIVSIRNKYIGERRLNRNKQVYMNLMENRDFRIEEVVNKLKEKMQVKDDRTVKRILEDNNVKTVRRSKTFKLIDSKIDSVMKEIEGKRPTNKLISSKLGVSIGTYKRWKSGSKNYIS